MRRFRKAVGCGSIMARGNYGEIITEITGKLRRNQVVAMFRHMY